MPSTFVQDCLLGLCPAQSGTLFCQAQHGRLQGREASMTCHSAPKLHLALPSSIAHRMVHEGFKTECPTVGRHEGCTAPPPAWRLQGLTLSCLGGGAVSSSAVPPTPGLPNGHGPTSLAVEMPADQHKQHSQLHRHQVCSHGNICKP